MTDTFVMSVGQAHELQTAFRRNGWSASEVKKLCQGDILARVKHLVIGPDPKELLIRDVFTIENCKSLGLSSNTRYRAIALGHEGIRTLGDLSKMTEFSFARQPGTGETSVALVKAVLAHYGLEFTSEIDKG
jgi:DNA-directed RNA polymerase alpha subunit